MAIEIGTDKQVFLDWSLIEPGYGLPWGGDPLQPWKMPYGVRIQVHAPALDPTPILLPEEAWEEAYINVYATVFEDEGRLRLFYESHADTRKGDFGAILCHAESTDGMHWERRPLGLVEFQGSRKNNIVYAESIPGAHSPHGAGVFKDPSAPPSERYKMIHCGKRVEQGRPVYGAVSPDGFHWTPISEPVCWHFSDTQTVVQYDSRENLYRGYFRGFTAANRRVVDQATTLDFRHWPRPERALEPGPDDPPDWDIYTNAYTPWPGAPNAHLLFPAFYCRAADTIELHMAVSRDGKSWARPQRQALIPAGPPESLLSCGIYAAQGVMALKEGRAVGDPDMADQWAIIVGPRRHTHNEHHYPEASKATMKTGLWRATIRPDGFTSLTADARGECWTTWVIFRGKQLMVNAWARFGGSVRIGIEDEKGPAPGFEVEACNPILGDALWKPVVWRNNANVGSLAGKPVRLHFSLVRARIHAFKFSE